MEEIVWWPFKLLVESEHNPIGVTIQINETLSFFFYSFSFSTSLKIVFIKTRKTNLEIHINLLL